jgi:hypothetical protein
VKPTRSAKSTVTTRRSTPCAGVAATVSTATRAVPHPPQKRWPGAYGVPQLGQAFASDAPQFVQNFWLSWLEAPQLRQSAMSGA